MSDAEKILRNLIEKIATEHNFDKNGVNIKAINSGGANYTSVLFLVTVKRGDKNVELFAKVVWEKVRELLDAKRMYYVEAYFYNKLVKIYNQLELKQGIADENKFVIPKFYGCNTNLHEETVVLQNLVAEGYGSYNRFISVDWEHASSSIEALAKFHALSFAYQKENPEEFDEVCQDLVYVGKKPDEKMKEFLTKCIERALSVVKDEYKAKIMKFLDDVGEDWIWKFRRPLGTKVIVHGDYKPSNLLYKRQGDKVHAIVLDYQTIHVGSPAADFMRFEICGTDNKFRAENHERLLDHYYKELSAALQRLNVDAIEVFPREVLDSELRQMMPFSVVLGMLILPRRRIRCYR